MVFAGAVARLAMKENKIDVKAYDILRIILNRMPGGAQWQCQLRYQHTEAVHHYVVA
jgi:hypothetical protein